MASINLIDPTQSNLAGNTDYQNLFIYVDMTAERKGYTAYDIDSNIANTSELRNVNLLGYKSSNKNIFTSDYTLIYNDVDNINYEGFGIKSIAIETNASYVPKITVDFVDIKGMAFFNNANESPYSILFDFPPPIFTLKIKGYYGKTLEYKLHMLRHNTRFNADDGNFYITAEFVGNTFAPLTDILFQNVLLVSKLENNEVNIDTKKNVNSLAELVAKSKTIKNDIIETVISSDKYKTLEETSKLLKEKRDYFQFIYDLPVNSAIVIVNKNKLTTENKVILDSSKYQLLKSKISLSQIPIEDNYEYYIVSNQPEFIKIDQIHKQLFNGFDVKIEKIFKEQDYINIFWNNKNNNLQINIIDGLNPKITYVNITQNLKDVISELDANEKNYSSQYSVIDNEVKDIVTNRLGFNPTIKNVMTIIANDIDKWIDQLVEVYNESSGIITNNSEIKRQFSGVDKIYPFPDFVENSKKTVPRIGTLSELPEVKFTDEFIKKFIDYKEDVRLEETKDTSNLTNNNNENIWGPVNPLDSSSLSDAVNPYINLKTVDDIFSVLFARLYIFYFHTHNKENADGNFIINYNLVKYFFKNEKDVILKSITDNKLLSAFENELKKPNLTNSQTFKQTFNTIKLNYNLINAYKDEILLSFGLNNASSSNEFVGGISFKNFENVPKISTDESFWIFFSLTREGATESDYIPNNYIQGYPIKRIDSNEIGMTINTENNIIFNDGTNDITGFISPLNDKNEINNVILNSINTTVLKKQTTGNSKLKGYIFNIIKDYYFNHKNDNYSKLYGILNLLYVPDLKIIDKILLTQPLSVNLPTITKLYISSLVYAINNDDIYKIDSEYITPSDNSLIDPNNEDSIYNIYKINFPSSPYKAVINNFIDYRSQIFDKLAKLSVNDKNKFINYFKEFAENELLVEPLYEFVTNLFTNGVNGIKLNTIDTTPIQFLFDKTTIINSTKITYSGYYPYGNSYFGDTTRTKNNLIKIFNAGISVTDEIRSLYSKLISSIPQEIEDRPKSNIDNEIKSNQEIRIETYYSFKNFVDRWLVTNESNRVSRNNVFYLNDGEGLINTFQFIDRASNPTIAENAIIDISILEEFENDYSVNMLTVISKLLNENGFEFYPLQNFMTFDSQKWTMDEVFTPQTIGIDDVLKAPRFTCMYVGGTSKYLNSNFNSKTSFKNDGILNLETDAPDFIDSNANTFGFRVKFGDGKQSIFSKIEVSTEEVQPTNESLKSMSLILDNTDKNAVNLAQNLFSTYEQRSYICKVTMFGNSMIQPTQYFMLENIPMFSGLYLILKVTHAIDGETNSMFTTFEGVRLPKEPRPFVTNAFDVYVKNYIDKVIIEPRNRIPDNNVVEEINIEKKDRTIHLLAGHYNEDNGAISRIGDLTIFEKDLTIELRDNLKQLSDTKKINTTIDNDTLSLSKVISDLNTKVKSNDIVFDIHFNASEAKNATGVEVLIKDTTNQNTINLAKEVANIISNTLGLTLRNGDPKYKLPSGVKTQAESARGDLGIFNINTTVILIEVCFMTNPNDYNTYIQNKTKLVNNLVELFSKIVINENDKNLLSVNTYNILNTLKYDNLNNRNTPSVIDNVTKFNELIGYTNFVNTKNGITYTAQKLKNVYTDSSNINFKNTIRTQIALTSNKYNIDSLFLAGILYIESNFNPIAISSTGALGIGQFIINAAMSDVLDYLDRNKSILSSVYTYNSNINQYEFTQKSYEQIINILFNNNSLSDINFGDNTLKTQLQNKKINNTTYYNILVDNIFNNPFIMIELSAIYLKILETKRVGTNINKNAGILSLSYNTGIHKLKNQNTNKPYFNHIIEYYNKTNSEDIKNRLSGNVKNEGIFYPERLINEYLSKFIDIDLTKSSIF